MGPDPGFTEGVWQPIRHDDRPPQLSPQDITKYPQLFLIAANFAAVPVDLCGAGLVRPIGVNSPSRIPSSESVAGPSWRSCLRRSRRCTGSRARFADQALAVVLPWPPGGARPGRAAERTARCRWPAEATKRRRHPDHRHRGRTRVVAGTGALGAAACQQHAPCPADRRAGRAPRRRRRTTPVRC